MKELHLVVNAEIEDRHARVKVILPGLVMSLDGAVEYTGESSLFKATFVYFKQTQTLTYELSHYVIRPKTETNDGGVVLLRETTGSLVPDTTQLSSDVEKVLRAEFPIIWSGIMQTLRSYLK